MDPVKIEQRRGHKKTKLPPPKNADLTAFQKAMVNNPYARALATHVRHCQITMAHLPSFFQIPFDFLPSPNPPHRTSIVPARLFSDVTPGVSYQKSGGSAYVQSRKSVLKYVTAKEKSGQLMAADPSSNGQRRKNLSKKPWRKDMDEVVLGLLQDAVVKSLKWGLKHLKAGLVVRCDGGASCVESIDGVACFIYQQTFGRHSDVEAQIDEHIHFAQSMIETVAKIEMAIRKHNNLNIDGNARQPPTMSLAACRPVVRYPVAPYKDRIIPVYSLMDLLGETKMEKLLKGTAFEDTRAFTIKEGNLTTNAQMALLRLHEYMN
ncbi:hypothetical protein FKW77_005425 [Venturia effusa]|uniref:Uncharacterized protein n=1 Tax=Venturia effusa TaxID=50376 RepID=A0A517L7D0_9PEZI|nr:hypothetical protein FKW77_005425 [Venturia effusa]